MQDQDVQVGAAKVVVAAVATFFGSITANQVLIFCTIVFTVFQTYFLIRDKWWRDPVRQAKRRQRKAAKRRKDHP